MKNQKGFANLVLIGVVVVLLALGGYFAWSKKTKPVGEETNTVQSQKSESEIIASLKTDWSTIQALIPFRPGHPGTTAWGSPNSVQFIGENKLLVGFEDGYNPGLAVLNFNNDKFTISETFKNQAEFTLSDWQNLVKKYGDASYSVSTYTTSLIRNKEIVSFPALTKVPENVFIKVSPPVLQNGTSNWKTYSNAEYGFEFQYPGDLIYREVRGTDGRGVSYLDVNVNTRENIEFKCDGCDGPSTFFKISRFKMTADPTSICFPPPQGEISKVSIGGIIGDKCVADGLNGPNLSIYLTKDKTMTMYNRISADNYFGEQKVLVDKIISTLKFTDTTSISSWKTYKNSEYGFELQYPATWKVQEKVTGSGVWVNPPEFKMPSSGTVNPYFSFDVTAHMYMGDEKPIIKKFGTQTGYVYTQDHSVYFPAAQGAGGYFIKIYTPAGTDEANQILSTFKFTK